MERFWKKVKKTDTCWLWQGYIWQGYGLFRHGSKKISAHRMSWKLLVGEIPDGLCILHKCDVRNCVNPGHLWIGTHKDNAIDREEKGRGDNGRKAWTHCKNGHEFNEKNTYIRKDRGSRECIACMKERTKKYRKSSVNLAR